MSPLHILTWTGGHLLETMRLSGRSPCILAGLVWLFGVRDSLSLSSGLLHVEIGSWMTAEKPYLNWYSEIHRAGIGEILDSQVRTRVFR